MLCLLHRRKKKPEGMCKFLSSCWTQKHSSLSNLRGMKEIQVTKREPVPQDGDGGIVPNKKKKIPVEKEVGQRLQVTGGILRQSNDWMMIFFKQLIHLLQNALPTSTDRIKNVNVYSGSNR